MQPTTGGPRLRPASEPPRRRGLPVAALVFIVCFLAVLAGTLWMLGRVSEEPAPAATEKRPG